MFSKNTTKRSRKVVVDIMGFKEMGSNSAYLGNTFIFSRNKSKDFAKLKDKITARLESWNGQLLSKAG